MLAEFYVLFSTGWSSVKFLRNAYVFWLFQLPGIYRTNNVVPTFSIHEMFGYQRSPESFGWDPLWRFFEIVRLQIILQGEFGKPLLESIFNLSSSVSQLLKVTLIFFFFFNKMPFLRFHCYTSYIKNKLISCIFGEFLKFNLKTHDQCLILRKPHDQAFQRREKQKFLRMKSRWIYLSLGPIRKIWKTCTRTFACRDRVSYKWNTLFNLYPFHISPMKSPKKACVRNSGYFIFVATFTCT